MLTQHYRSMTLKCIYMLQFVGTLLARQLEHESYVYFDMQFREF